jgi:hypothetical protein
MKSSEDIESYLIQMGVPFDSMKDGMWIVKDTGTDLIVSMAESVVVFRVKVLDVTRVPAAKREELYRRLLELNAREMMHGAYGLEEGAVVITDALQLENLDFNEFQATLEDVGLAVSNHYPLLSNFIA